MTTIWANYVYCSLLCASLGASIGDHACAEELIRNGSFEVDDPVGGGPFRTGWDDGANLGNDVGFGLGEFPFVLHGVVQFGGGFELPPDGSDAGFTGDVGPHGAGNYFSQMWGAWNGTGRSGSATQHIDLTGHAQKRFEFSAWLASRMAPDDFDYATITLEFFDQPSASGNLLGSIVFDGDDQGSAFIVGSLNLDGFPDPSIPATQDNWTLYRARGTIPTRASGAAVVIRGAVPPGVPGFGNDAYVDLVSLQLVPEPSTTILMAALLPVLMILRHQFSRLCACETGGNGPHVDFPRLINHRRPANRVRRHLRVVNR